MTVTFYKNSNKKEPVREFLNTLEKDSKTKVGAKIRLVSEILKNHQSISKGLFKKIDDDIWEIRVNNIRIFVLLYYGNMYLLHAIIKKRNDILKKALSLANERAKEIKSYIYENKK
ncbi:type II toxin-antitoxin system RelE/ParE family toxin [Brachyspira pilosicoli]|uniref:type II toxin-antitoxin system RelE/ParE family toxin n=1 Tax=Brachyspira pilosicoli TaxID=52584 RepID=UPI003007D995